METADGKLLPVAGYGRLCLLVDQEDGSFRGETQVLALDRVAHVPQLGAHNLISAKRLARAFDAPMRIYPATATIQPRRGGKPLAFRMLRSDSDVFEVKARRCTAAPGKRGKSAPTRSPTAAKQSTKNIMEFHRLLGHPSEDITVGPRGWPGCG